MSTSIPSSVVVVVVFLSFPLLLQMISISAPAQQQWCVARSGASDEALQAALDYACGRGMADCRPIRPNGLCYLPNTLQAHASYVFNSYFQRSRDSPAACDFAAAATVTITDPSYGSCTFPSSASTAGVSTTPTAPNTNTSTTDTPSTATPLTNALPPPVLGSLTPSVGHRPLGSIQVALAQLCLTLIFLVPQLFWFLFCRLLPVISFHYSFDGQKRV